MRPLFLPKPLQSLTAILVVMAAVGFGLQMAEGQTLTPANPIAGTMPRTSFSLQLEELTQLPDSSSGSNRFARIEQITPALDEAGKLYVQDQRGRFYSYTPGDPSPSLLFDFSANIPNFRNGNQQSGVRGFAFHPNAFTSPEMPGYRKMYTAHEIETAPGGNSHTSVVSEWTLNSLGRPINNSRRDILTQVQPRGDHNIGKLAFNPNLSSGDPDFGNLYISFGDGGNYRTDVGDTTLNPNGQDNSNFLGTMLRINPLESGNDAYTIPADNPFLSDGNILDEIWAYGLRNPHQFSWDTGGNNDLLIADIGQSNIEEVNLGVAGANYGWSIREGTFDMTGKLPGNPIAADVLPANHVNDPYTYPVIQYDHDPDNDNVQDNAAIAGGFVYRGSLIPELYGKYVFGNFGSDLNSQDIFVVDVDQLQVRDDFTNLSSLSDGFLAPVQILNLVDGNGNPTTFLNLVRQKSGNNGQSRADIRFGIDEYGEIYVSSKKDGTIRRFVTTRLPGDYNADGVVDAADYTVWRDTLGQSTDLRADGNDDKTVDAADYQVWKSNFGNAGSAGAVIPEPASLSIVLAMLGGLAASFRQRS